MNNLDFPLEIRNERWLNCLIMVAPFFILGFSYPMIIHPSIIVSLSIPFIILLGILEFSVLKKGKVNVWLILFIKSIFFFLFFYFLNNTFQFNKPTQFLLLYSSIIGTTFGIATALLGCFVFSFLFKVLIDKRPNMVIDNNGIVVNYLGTGFSWQILWTDIEDFTTEKIQYNKFIKLKIKNKEAYKSAIDSQKKSLWRLFTKYSLKKNDGALYLSSPGSNITFKDLEYLVKKNVEARREDGEIAYNA